jgi:hypothetical protein
VNRNGKATLVPGHFFLKTPHLNGKLFYRSFFGQSKKIEDYRRIPFFITFGYMEQPASFSAM